MRSLLVIGVLAILLFGCVNQPPVSNTTVTQPTNPLPGQTVNPLGPSTQPTQNQSLSPDTSVSIGDHVWIDYTLWINGTVYDTSNATLANQSGIYNPARTYAPIDFDVIYGQGIITGMINDLVGMHVNETETFDVPPSEGYGPYDPSKVIVVPRYYNMSLYEVVPLSYFQQHGITNVTNGTAFNTPYGQIFITDINSQNVTIFYYGIANPGANFTYNNVPQSVYYVNKNVTMATIEEMLDVNNTYNIPDPSTGAQSTFLVTNKTDTNITLDGNSPLANDTLHFKITVLKITRNNQTIG